MRVVRHIVRLVGDYRVVLLVLVVCAVATRLARWSLGPDPSRADVTELGYGLPSVQDGRLWTLLTGMVLTRSLTTPVPIFSLIGIALYEHVARHWRTVVVLVGGQVLGVLLVCGLLYPVRNVDGERIQGYATAVDFGMSVGGFATIGAGTAYLPAHWRRRLRLGLSCYFPGPMVASGLIYNLTHPAGWCVGLALGVLLRDAPGGAAPLTRREVPGLVVAATLGALTGIFVGRL